MVVEGVTEVTLEQRLGGGEGRVPADIRGKVHWAEGTARAKALGQEHVGGSQERRPGRQLSWSSTVFKASGVALDCL